MANTNSTTSTPTPVQAQQPGNQQPLLAYDPTHEDVLVGEIPNHFFELHRTLTGILRTPQANQLPPELRDQLVHANAVSEQLWFALMRLAKDQQGPTVL